MRQSPFIAAYLLTKRDHLSRQARDQRKKLTAIQWMFSLSRAGSDDTLRRLRCRRCEHKKTKLNHRHLFPIGVYKRRLCPDFEFNKEIYQERNADRICGNGMHRAPLRPRAACEGSAAVSGGCQRPQENPRSVTTNAHKHTHVQSHISRNIGYTHTPRSSARQRVINWYTIVILWSV